MMCHHVGILVFIPVFDIDVANSTFSVVESNYPQSFTSNSVVCSTRKGLPSFTIDIDDCPFYIK